MARSPFRKRHADFVDHVALKLTVGALGQVKVLVVLSFLTAAGSIAKQAQMPGRGHASMAHDSAKKLHQPGNKKSGLAGALRQRTDGRDQFRGKALIGVQVQLPRVAQGQIVDGPVSLRAIVFKGMLDDLRAMLLPALRHRFQLNYAGEADRIDAEALLTRVFDEAVREAT